MMRATVASLGSRSSRQRHVDELDRLSNEASIARAHRVVGAIAGAAGHGSDRLARIEARFRYAMIAERITVMGSERAHDLADRIEAMVSAVVLASAEPLDVRLFVDTAVAPLGNGMWLCIMLREMMAAVETVCRDSGATGYDVLVGSGSPGIAMECIHRGPAVAVLRSNGAAALARADRMARAFTGTVRRHHDADRCAIRAEFPNGMVRSAVRRPVSFSSRTDTGHRV